MDSEPKDSNCRHRRLFVYFQMFKSTYQTHFFNIDFAMYSVQPDKILRKNVNFKGLKWNRTRQLF
jgi:hypothetical protein